MALGAPRDAYGITEGRKSVVVGARAVVLGALAFVGGTSGDFVSPTQTLTPYATTLVDARGVASAATAASLLPR